LTCCNIAIPNGCRRTTADQLILGMTAPSTASMRSYAGPLAFATQPIVCRNMHFQGRRQLKTSGFRRKVKIPGMVPAGLLSLREPCGSCCCGVTTAFRMYQSSIVAPAGRRSFVAQGETALHATRAVAGWRSFGSRIDCAARADPASGRIVRSLRPAALPACGCSKRKACLSGASQLSFSSRQFCLDRQALEA